MIHLSESQIQDLVERGVRPDQSPHSPAVAAERTAGAFSGNVAVVAKYVYVRAATGAVFVEVTYTNGERFCFALRQKQARGVAIELAKASIAAEKDMAGLKAYQTLTHTQHKNSDGAGEALLHGAGSAGHSNVEGKL